MIYCPIAHGRTQNVTAAYIVQVNVYRPMVTALFSNGEDRTQSPMNGLLLDKGYQQLPRQ